ncbi:hypothetical protein Sjap_002193 [Stephania japonica]|uniref:Uncharacterized protein n=1 Tax=Stephania japonica TaxID=461633 RepID=A0AAP0KN20_9MAGN
MGNARQSKFDEITDPSQTMVKSEFKARYTKPFQQSSYTFAALVRKIWYSCVYRRGYPIVDDTEQRRKNKSQRGFLEGWITDSWWDLHRDAHVDRGTWPRKLLLTILTFTIIKEVIQCPFNIEDQGKTIHKPSIKTLKRVWFIVNDMIHGVNHCSNGFNFNSTPEMFVVEDDVWDDYLAKYLDAKQWRSKLFIHYEKCCIIFGNDRTTREDAFNVVDVVEEFGGNNESNSENGSDPITLKMLNSLKGLLDLSLLHRRLPGI